MSRPRIITQGALAMALLLAGVTTVFVRIGGDDVASPAPSPTPTVRTSPTMPATTEPAPDPTATLRASVREPKVLPRAPLTKQQAARPPRAEIVEPTPQANPQPKPRPERKPSMTCASLSDAHALAGRPAAVQQAVEMGCALDVPVEEIDESAGPKASRDVVRARPDADAPDQTTVIRRMPEPREELPARSVAVAANQ